MCKRYPAVFTLFSRGFFPAWLKKPFSKSHSLYEMHELSEHEAHENIPLVSGCFMLCRADSLKAVKGFDENYFLYFEDFDLSKRISEVGNLAYLPSMKIIHHGGNASRKGIRHFIFFLRSAVRFFNTYGWRLIQ